MAITAAEVNKLRQMTGSGMMDCKKALTESEGDFEKAIEILRKKGQKVAANRGDREASEGLVIAKTTGDSKKGVLVVLNCETDFVAKNEDFTNFANRIVDIAVEKSPANIEDLIQLKFNGDGLTISDKIMEYVGKIGEKIEVSRYDLIEAETVVAYNHPGNKVASIVGLNKGGEKTKEAGRDVAMQIAAMAPIAVDKADVPQDLINKEIEIGKELAINEGKPADMAEKIAVGKLNKFFKDSTLLNQEFIKDNKLSVAQYLNNTENGLTVKSFKRASLN